MAWSCVLRNVVRQGVDGSLKELDSSPYSRPRLQHTEGASELQGRGMQTHWGCAGRAPPQTTQCAPRPQIHCRTGNGGTSIEETLCLSKHAAARRSRSFTRRAHHRAGNDDYCDEGRQRRNPSIDLCDSNPTSEENKDLPDQEGQRNELQCVCDHHDRRERRRDRDPSRPSRSIE